MNTTSLGIENYIILFMGAPGSGKGTHSASLSQKLQVPHISTGDLFRENLQKKTVLGKKAAEFIRVGKLVPDELVLDLLFSRIEEKDCEGGLILDGFPRNLKQAEALEKRLSSKEVVVFHLDLSFDLLVERITGRLSCPSCKSCFHKRYVPPLKEGVCNHCETNLLQREDDKEETLKKRLQIYKEESFPVIEFYQKKGSLHAIDASKKPEEVFEETLQALKKAITKQEALLFS